MSRIENAIVIDDDELCRWTVSELLKETLGLSPEKIHQLGESVPVLEEVLTFVRGKASLVICDRNLTSRGQEGDQITRSVREKDAHVVLFSSHIPDEVRKELEALGICCINKTDSKGLRKWMVSFL